MRQLADIVRKFDPEMADFLTDARFVDDLNDTLAISWRGPYDYKRPRMRNLKN